MAAASTSFKLSVPSEMAERVDALKKAVFFDKPYAEIFRYLIQLGLDEIQEKQGSRAS